MSVNVVWRAGKRALCKPADCRLVGRERERERWITRRWKTRTTGSRVAPLQVQSCFLSISICCFFHVWFIPDDKCVTFSYVYTLTNLTLTIFFFHAQIFPFFSLCLLTFRFPWCLSRWIISPSVSADASRDKVVVVGGENHFGTEHLVDRISLNNFCFSLLLSPWLSPSVPCFLARQSRFWRAGNPGLGKERYVSSG